MRDQNGNDITASSVIYIDGIAITGNVFTTSTAKTFLVKAVAGGIESGMISVMAKPHTTNRFSRKIILEEFAGTWCGFCPETTRQVDSLAATDNKIIPIQVHNGESAGLCF
ncbi:MAG: hypothetical protein HC867_04325 [Bacteroidia bacterium]|nr:hypothetical protein [Bacteroidia bacterium]